MKIINLEPGNEKLYCCCLEDWSEEICEIEDQKEYWYNKMKGKGLRVKLSQSDKDEIGGMIQYLPIEESEVAGSDLYYVLCIWVHGYKKGRGNFQKKGMGSALLKAAEEDARNSGAKGMVAWGVILPFFMRAAWFKKQGYKVADRKGIMRLIWKPFVEDAQAPRFMKQRKKPGKTPGKLNISVFINGWCPAQNLVYERTKRAMIDFRDNIDFNVYHTIDKEIQHEWGITDALFIDGKKIWSGPPPTYKRLRRIIERKVKGLKNARVSA